ncbi:TetR/AcrR family transcriptional regulator [uncultured Sphingomonas sp.]|uniref:TetR/AcrR family transcriptional regulator n=1 Tax=uncultured Sphingomonas sp. TaxID=158754 RepID=UPI0035CA705A
MRYCSEHKAQTRERVLAAAAAAIRADGPERVSVAALMACAGLTHGGFYAHWPSKDAFLADAIDRMFADGAATYLADPDADPREVLARYVDDYLSMTHRDGRARGCPAPTLAGEQHRLPEQARERFAAAIVRMIGRVGGLLERGGIDEPQARAASAVAEMVGAVALARVMAAEPAEALLAAARRSVRAKLDLPASAAA